MRRIIVSVFISLFSFSAFSQDIIDSPVDSVVLFSGQAQVTRRASFKALKGLNTIQIGIVEFQVDPDSVRARIMGQGEIYSVQYKSIYLKDEPQADLDAAQKHLYELKMQKRKLTDAKTVLSKREEFVSSIIKFSAVELPKKIQTDLLSLDKLNQTAQFIAGELAALAEAKIKCDIELDELAEKIQQAENELAAMSRPHQKVQRIIEILFDSEKEQKIEISASYVAFNASWSPLYKVDVTDDLSSASLTMFARIRQQTGQDWDNVSISVSNAVPLRGAELPSAYPWELDIARPRPEKKSKMYFNARAAGSMQTDAFSQVAAPVALEELPAYDREIRPEPASLSVAVKTELPLSFEYDLPQKLAVESKADDTILPLMVKPVNGDFYAYSVPARDSQTYSVCAAQADKELLPGPLNVYVGSRFLGKTYMSEKKPGEKMYVNLGVDRGVRIKKEKIKDQRDETFFGKIDKSTITRKFEYLISIDNLKEEQTEVHILDFIPVSQTDRITVKDVAYSIEPTDRDYQNKSGFNRWILKVEPKQKSQIQINFTVTYPKDAEIQGLQ